MHPSIQLKKATPIFVIASMLACFGLAPTAQAQCTTLCDGSPDFNTAFGTMALPTDNGNANTAIGFDALLSNTTGGSNTATGFAALQFNTTGVNNTAGLPFRMRGSETVAFSPERASGRHCRIGEGAAVSPRPGRARRGSRG